jgi:hypothetical protein
MDGIEQIEKPTRSLTSPLKPPPRLDPDYLSLVNGEVKNPEAYPSSGFLDDTL